MDYPLALHRDGLAGEPVLYAYGSLVLWTIREEDLSRGLSALERPVFRRVALADPRLAPYGRAAFSALGKAGLLERVRSKLVYGESIAQVNHFVLSGAADAGLTAKPVVLAPRLKGRGRWVEVDPSLYDRIAQGAAATRRGLERRPLETRRFIEFLRSREARAVLERHGYAPPR
jgi:molybdate transport system substrate-binding protein